MIHYLVTFFTIHHLVML